MELQAAVEAAGAGASIGPVGGEHGMWGGSSSGSSRGTTPSNTTSSSGGRLQPTMHRQASEPAGRVSNGGVGSWGGGQ
jgi:hypothetical protein